MLTVKEIQKTIPFDLKNPTVLGKKQELFSWLLPHLYLFAQTLEPTIGRVRSGDLFRDPRAFGKFGDKMPKSYSSARSCHKLKLAIDLYVVQDNILAQHVSSYRQLGEFWTSLHPLCRWGGDWEDVDANHFSITHKGVE